MAQNIRYKINIAGLFVKSGTVSAPQFMRRNLFCSRDLRSVLFYHIFHRFDIHAFPLGGIEECVFMAGDRCYGFSVFYIDTKSLRHFLPEVYDHFIAAFAEYLDSVVVEINIFDIQTYAFRNTDAGA